MGTSLLGTSGTSHLLGVVIRLTLHGALTSITSGSRSWALEKVEGEGRPHWVASTTPSIDRLVTWVAASAERPSCVLPDKTNVQSDLVFRRS